MKMDKVASSQNDEFYTPEYAIKPILKYIKMPCTIWCPFDTEESNFVKLLSQYAACGVSVIHAHIATGGGTFSNVSRLLVTISYKDGGIENDYV